MLNYSKGNDPISRLLSIYTLLIGCFSINKVTWMGPTSCSNHFSICSAMQLLLMGTIDCMSFCKKGLQWQFHTRLSTLLLTYDFLYLCHDYYRWIYLLYDCGKRNLTLDIFYTYITVVTEQVSCCCTPLLSTVTHKPFSSLSMAHKSINKLKISLTEL